MPEDVAYRQWRGEKKQKREIEREPTILLDKMWPKPPGCAAATPFAPDRAWFKACA
jgi:hypothetical protein